MISTAIKTKKIKPGDSIFWILDNFLEKLVEGDVVAIASKIISICEQQLINKTAISKKKLIQQESDICITAPAKLPNFFLTLKNHRLIPNAGIDESNCNNKYSLLPKNPQTTAHTIWLHLKKRYNLKKLGVFITDSNVTPLRSGVTGIAIGWCGFKPIYSYIGKQDVFKRKICVTKINLLDSLATVATLTMGEGAEQTPLAILKNVPKIKFQNRQPTKQEEQTTRIDKHHDLFSNLNFNLLKFYK
jgi:putative folate metabolism gamma-glutamate ligase